MEPFWSYEQHFVWQEVKVFHYPLKMWNCLPIFEGALIANVTYTLSVLVKQPNLIQLNFFKRNSPVFLLSSFARQVTCVRLMWGVTIWRLPYLSLDGRRCKISVWRSKHCLEQFYHLRTATNFQMTLPAFMYSFWSLSNKLPTIFWSLIFAFYSPG